MFFSCTIFNVSLLTKDTPKSDPDQSIYQKIKSKFFKQDEQSRMKDLYKRFKQDEQSISQRQDEQSISQRIDSLPVPAETKKQLQGTYPQLSYSPSKDVMYGVVEGYQQILKNAEANLGWRIIAECFLGIEEQKRILNASEDGSAIKELLDPSFVDAHLRSISIIWLHSLQRKW